MENVLSIDFESWVHRNFTGIGANKLESNYIENCTDGILKILDKFGIKSTFFIVGELYDWYPESIKKIRDAGHEIGYHTHTHKLLEDKNLLATEIRKSEKFLKKFKPVGFRAPETFIRRCHFDLLRKSKFKYDSSTYGPIDMVGIIDGIMEIPISSMKILRTANKLSFPRNIYVSMTNGEIPFGSGFFLSLFGTKISYFIKKINSKNQPAVLFVHPWQIFNAPNYRIIEKSFLFKIKQASYSMNRRDSFVSLLKKHKFCRFEDLIESDLNGRV
jgi:hypothetical protein